MENKIQELTDKIYREGVEKGNEEAQKIVENAQKEADSIVAAARKSADELAENTKSELKLFAGQAVNALKSEIATLILNKKNGIKVTHFHKKYRFSPVLFRKDNNKIKGKKK